jgi:hypothetical protein
VQVGTSRYSPVSRGADYPFTLIDKQTKGRRLIAFIDYRGNAGWNCDLMSKEDNQSLRGQTLRRESTSHGITLSRHDVLESVAYEEGFPVISRLFAGITPSSGNSITRQGISL